MGVLTKDNYPMENIEKFKVTAFASILVVKQRNGGTISLLHSEVDQLSEAMKKAVADKFTSTIKRKVKSFKRTYLPDQIEYNKKVYTLDAAASGLHAARKLVDYTNCIKVEVLPRTLKGKTDIYGQLYRPTEHIFRAKSIEDLAMEWWRDCLSDAEKDQMMVKFNMRKPIGASAVVHVYIYTKNK